MLPDPFKMAADGWNIISRPGDSRENARALLRYIVDTMGASLAALRFHDAATGYGWEERVDRITSEELAPTGELGWERPFPSGDSFWFFKSLRGSEEHYGPALDLLARQWLHLRRPDAAFSGRLRLLETANEDLPSPSGWVAVSRQSRIIATRLPRLAFSRKPLLIIGPTGSGKNHLAALIHKFSPEPSLPFTGPEITGTEGTLVIRDWRTVPIRRRRELLDDPRRIIACITPNGEIDGIRRLWKSLTGNIGQTLTVPALKDRKEDIPALAGRFLDGLVAGSNQGSPELSATAVEALLAYPWPGNARELKEAMTVALDLISEGQSRIGIGDLPPAVRGALHAPSEPSFPERLVALEYEALKEELSRQRGNMTRTAHALGLTPRQVSWRVRKYGIDPREFKPHRQDAR